MVGCSISAVCIANIPVGSVVIQNGMMAMTQSGFSILYNSTRGIEINNQYAASYNNFQGTATYPFDTSTSVTITENYSNYKFRVLLRFDDIFRFITSTSVILRATLSIPISYTYSPPASIQACFMTKFWDNRPHR